MSDGPTLCNDAEPRYITSRQAWPMCGCPTRDQWRRWVRNGIVGPQYLELERQQVYLYSEFMDWLLYAKQHGKFLNRDEWATHKASSTSPTGTDTKPRHSRRRKSVPESQFDSAKG